MNGAVSHLLPCVQSVAICAKQSQVSLVRRPITKAVIPNAGAALVPKLFAWVDMINVENTKVGLATVNARPAKLRNEGELPTPVARMLVPLVGMDRPVSVAAGAITKAVLARLPALLARFSALPSGGKIASLPTVFTAAIPQTVKVHFKRLGAMRANDLDGALFHCRSITQSAAQPKYFDIACKRIEDAQRQGDMFTGRAA